VKVWIFKGEILAHDPMEQDKRMAEMQAQGPAGGGRDRDRDGPRRPRGDRRGRGGPRDGAGRENRGGAEPVVAAPESTEE
jgi:small subunit ribosomal protein S3